MLATTVFGGFSWQLVCFVAVICVGGYLALKLPYWKPKGKEVTCQATVCGKRVEYSNTHQIYYRGNRWNHIISFRDENDELHDLYVGEAAYNDFVENTSGTLTYQNDKVVDFVCS